MKTLYVGTYTATEALGLPDREIIGVKIYLHRLDPNNYVIGDDVDGQCLADTPVAAKIGEKAMRGDLCALTEASAEIASLMNRPQFKLADSLIVTETDPSLLTSASSPNRYSPDISSR